MGAAYALLGLVLGIVINEAVRRGMRNAGKHAGPRRNLRQPWSLGASERDAKQPPPLTCCRFTAQDYYDR